MIFYYDETFHDRRLTIKDGLLNAYLDNSNDGYVYALLGGDEERLQAFLDDYTKLEEETKEKLGISGELKSTTFSRKSFTYGIASLRKDSRTFYYEFFDLLIKHNILFQIGSISKTEVLVRRFLQYVMLPSAVPIKSFIYSLTKLLVNHRLECLFNSLLNDNRNNIKGFVSSFLDLLNTLLANIKDIKREEVEIIVINNIVEIFSYSYINDSGGIDCDWDYSIIAGGVKNRIDETLCESTVIIDKEQSTFDEFCKRGICCKQEDSNNSIGIRSTDMFVGFVGRMIRSLKEDIKEPPLKTIGDIKKELYTNKRLISSRWFDINQEEFVFYKRLGDYFSSATHWSSFSLCYGDDLMMFFSLFNYINSYDDYDSYKKNMKMHSEYYNTYLCKQVNDLYSDEGTI